MADADAIQIPRKVQDLTGRTFHSWTVLEFAGVSHGHARWLCRCDCGAKRTVSGDYLKRGRSKSCSLCPDRVHGGTAIRHGHSSSITYTSWSAMKQRCRDPNTPYWHLYGGRGIRVCDRWLASFENFLADMGERPSKAYSIDRINCDGNYEPSNCRWATRKEQQNNLRRKPGSQRMLYHGRNRSEWAKLIGMHLSTLCDHIARGNSIPYVIETRRPLIGDERAEYLLSLAR